MDRCKQCLIGETMSFKRMVIAVMQLFVLSIRCDVVYDWLDSEGDITATESYDFKGEWFLDDDGHAVLRAMVSQCVPCASLRRLQSE